MRRITSESEYVPDGLLTPWELNRLDIDNYGAILHLDANQRIMISSMYIFAKCLVLKVLLVEAADPEVTQN